MDLQHLEAARQRRVFLDMALVLGPCRCAYRADRTARKGRLEQVRGIAGAGLPARADQRVDLVHKQDCGSRTRFRRGQHAFEARLEFALHARARQQRANVQAQELCVGQLRRHIAPGDGQRQPFHDGSLADARLPRQQGIVLPAANQNVDHRADLQFPADHRIDPTGTRAGSQVYAVLLKRGTGHRGVSHGAGRHAGHRGREIGALVGLIPLLRRIDDPGRQHGIQIRHADLRELGGNRQEYAPQLGRFQQGRHEPGAAHARVAEL
ncbi:hypothetical protein D3C86_1032090 [compost metagenome]